MPFMSKAGNTQPDGDSLSPQRAAVMPRGRWSNTKASLPIERLLLRRIEAKAPGHVLITAPPGGGKTSALRHLRAVLPSDAQIAFFDGDLPSEAFDVAASKLVVSSAANANHATKSVSVIELSPWTLDDCVAYLAALHRDQCASVLSRLKEDQTLAIANGSPQLLALILDAMAGDPALTSSREVLRRHLVQVIPPGWTRDRVELDKSARAVLSEEQRRWWRHEAIKHVFTAEWISEQLCNGEIPTMLNDAAQESPWAWEIAAAARHRPEALEFLARLVDTNPRAFAVPMAASILLRADPNWRPRSAARLFLKDANLSSARWDKINLREATLRGANFAGADLRGADLSNASASTANFTGANLRGARLERTWLDNANFWSANLCNAVLEFSGLHQANLCGAQCERANFSHTRFSNAIIDGANFRSAIFVGAILEDVDLGSADWTGALFMKAGLHRCNLEGLDLPSADFSYADLRGSLLTGSRIRGGNFRGASLRETGLAEIEWENADLRDADFTDASFHLGSTRSGLVGSIIPGEGSRTGFYTDDFQEQNFKAPEEIRKACLCGANFLGAKVEGTDFYLVDLRGAVYSAEQRKHFSRSGAILASPAA
jgi:uncharacterized protein YjbI with pentapeptide repeats